MSGSTWTTQDYVYVTAECVTGVLSVLGNGLVLLAIAKTRALRTVTNCFIGSLAAADMLVGFVIPPTVVLSYLGTPHHFYGCVLLNSLVVLITNISILNLLAVALERFLAISDPFRYQRVMTVRRAMGVVVLTWVVAVLIGLVPTMGWNLGDDGFQSCSFTAVIDMRYMVYLIFFGVNLPPLVSMLVIYVYIFHIIRKQQQAMSVQLTVLSREERRQVQQQRREVRGAKGLAYVIVLFALCWMPLHVMNSITLFRPEKSAPIQWLLVAIVLSHANSFINPFLYAFSYTHFKRAMKRILCCGRLHGAVSSDSSDGKGRVSKASPGLGTRRPPANPSRSVAANGHVPADTSTDSVSSEDSDRGKRAAGSAPFTVENGVVNRAFDAGSLDLEGGAPSSPSAFARRKSLRWDDSVETIPSSVEHPSTNGVCQDNCVDSSDSAVDEVVVVTEHVETSPHGTDIAHNSVWVTSSSLSIDSQLPSSPPAQALSATPPPCTEQIDPVAYSTPTAAETQHDRTSAVAETLVHTDHALQDSVHTLQRDDVTCGVTETPCEGNGAQCSPPSTQTDSTFPQQDEREEEAGEELNVMFWCSADVAGTDEDFGSKQFVSVRL